MAAEIVRGRRVHDISTDEIMPAGARVLPYRSNIPKISEFVFDMIDPSYPQRALEHRMGHAIVAGSNYGQGSSREHAALAPRYLGLRVVIVKGFARIHRQNLVNFGILPLIFRDPADYESLENGAVILLKNLHRQLRGTQVIALEHAATGRPVSTRHLLDSEEAVPHSGITLWRPSSARRKPISFTTTSSKALALTASPGHPRAEANPPAYFVEEMFSRQSVALPPTTSAGSALQIRVHGEPRVSIWGRLLRRVNHKSRCGKLYSI